MRERGADWMSKERCISQRKPPCPSPALLMLSPSITILWICPKGFSFAGSGTAFIGCSKDDNTLIRIMLIDVAITIGARSFLREGLEINDFLLLDISKNRKWDFTEKVHFKGKNYKIIALRETV